MEIPIKCVLEMGNWLASASVGKRAESRSAGFWVADGECSPRGNGISTGSVIGGGDDGCSSMGGGGNGCSSMGGGGTVGKGSLSGEARGEMVSMLAEDSSVGDEGDERCSSVGEGTGEVGSNVEVGFWARISSMEGM
ncbi:hypothetical protein KI387_024909 [Taxus chinensis]|uniref:Uncharacterized protein n=1 Tax=Taxus chinensis TaxID=29808 RepID=A0AA38LD64_TAXCH|nr:hypothetical protein KI387_024909 [Taxus chinensis]